MSLPDLALLKIGKIVLNLHSAIYTNVPSVGIFLTAEIVRHLQSGTTHIIGAINGQRMAAKSPILVFEHT